MPGIPEMPELPELPDRRSIHVHQAAGMVAAQAGCDIAEAFALLTIRAGAMGQTLEEIALDVLDRVVRFSP